MSCKEWQEVKLGEVVSVKGGKRLPKGVNLITTPNAHPYIRIRDLGGSKYLELNSSYEYVDDHTQQQIAKYIVNSGDILISIVGTIGLVAIVGDSLDNANLTENCVKLVDLKNVCPDFLYYYLTSSLGQSEITKGTVGAVQAKLPIKNIQDISICLPGMYQQKRIAAILSVLDSKIEFNSRINDNLEQQAQAIFKSWFVDFEPFQDGDFTESEMGLIPTGWSCGNLEDIIELFDYKRVPISGSERDKMGKIYPYYGAATLMDYVDNYIFDGIYLLLGEDGTVMDEQGYPILQYVWGKFWVNNHAHILQGATNFSVEYLYLLLKNTSVKGIVTGAVQPKINQANLRSLRVIIPTSSVASSFSSCIAPLFNKVRQRIEEMSVLSNLRDTLLPKLMSGELSVDEAERQL